MKVTIRDIAKKSGVSLATVSRVLNNSSHVSDAARQRVQAAITELNYIPSAYARSLSRCESNIIGVIIPEVTNPFFSRIIQGINETGDESGLNVLLFNTGGSVDKEARALRILQEYRIRGLIITPVSGVNEDEQDWARRLDGLNIPVVLMNRILNSSSLDGVCFDDTAAMFQLTSLLLENGHRDILHLVGDPQHVVSRPRIQGYMDAHKAHGVPYYPESLLTGEFCQESAYELTRQRILSRTLPTAFLCAADTLSMGCLKALYQHGIRIPEDVAFAGCDQLEMLEVLDLNLTLAEKDAREMGRRAARLLIDKLSGSAPSGCTALMPELRIRGSEQFPEDVPHRRHLHRSRALTPTR